MPREKREIGALIERLESLMDQQTALHEGLRRLIAGKQEALRTASMSVLAELCRQEQALVHELTELEKRRLETVGAITERLQPAAAAPLSLQQIADALDEAAAARLLERRRRMRCLIDEIRSSGLVVRDAAEALGRHMAGIMLTVQSALSRAGVYGRKGRVETGSQVRYSVDLKR